MYSNLDAVYRVLLNAHLLATMGSTSCTVLENLSPPPPPPPYLPVIDPDKEVEHDEVEQEEVEQEDPEIEQEEDIEGQPPNKKAKGKILPYEI